VVGWASVARVITVDNGRNSQEATDTMVVGIRKIFIFFSDLAGKHLQPYGGKTGMAMIKYPLYKKNNSRNITHRIPAPKPCQTG